MPPVFGPRSPSRARLASRAGASASTRSPSQSASTDASRPSSRSSIRIRAPLSPKRCSTRQARTAWSASAIVSQTKTPLPAASPSALMTTRPPASAMLAWAAATVSQTVNRAVGTPASSMTDLANTFDPSRRALAAVGPNVRMPAASSRSARPATSGASGPITTRSAAIRPASSVRPSRSSTATSCTSAMVAIPGFPGAACSSPSSGEERSFQASACSRPPDPTTRTRIGARVYLTGTRYTGIAARRATR